MHYQEEDDAVLQREQQQLREESQHVNTRLSSIHTNNAT